MPSPEWYARYAEADAAYSEMLALYDRARRPDVRAAYHRAAVDANEVCCVMLRGYRAVA